MTTHTLDRRLHAWRDDLADVRLQGRVTASRFIAGQPAHAIAPITSVMRTPADDAMQLTQMLLGENVAVFENQNGWAWVQLETDCYVGYVRANTIALGHLATSHHVAVPLTHIYPSASIKTQPATAIPMLARLAIESTSGDFATTTTGTCVYAAHLSQAREQDFVAVAERFLHTPYLWGGKSVLGIDCSGLVQVSLHACGHNAPRDSDMQEKDLGTAIAMQDVRRGDLVFWKGHVGIMQDATTLLHANGHNMQVVSEPLQLAVERIAAKGSPVTALKRLQ